MYIFRIMKCTMFQLFPFYMGAVACEGPSSKLSDLNASSAGELLRKFNCPIKGSEVSIAQLILNKVSPEYVDIEKVRDVEICENHKNRMTHKHKSLRQKMCAVENCTRLGESGRPRVTLEMCQACYNVYGLLVPIGSTLCPSHRKDASSVGKVSTCTKVSTPTVSTVSITTVNTATVDMVSSTSSQKVPVVSVVSTHSLLESLSPVVTTDSTDRVITSSNPKVSTASNPKLSSIPTNKALTTSPHLVSSDSTHAIPRTQSSSTASDYVSRVSTTPALAHVITTTSTNPVTESSNYPVTNTSTQIVSTTSITTRTRASTKTVSATRLNTSVHSELYLSLPQRDNVPKRKCFSEALERLPKFSRTDSDTDSIGNSQPQLSQGSTFSTTSEVETETQRAQFNQLVACIALVDPVLAHSLSEPFSLGVQDRTLERYDCI